MEEAPAPATPVPAGLDETLEVKQLEESTIIYLEKRGPFSTVAPQACGELFALVGSRGFRGKTMMGLMFVDETIHGDQKYIYQAAFNVEEGVDLNDLPESVHTRVVEAGSYASFMFRGPYNQLGAAFDRAFVILRENDLVLRRDFCIEKYISPVGPPEDPSAEILIPVE